MSKNIPEILKNLGVEPTNSGASTGNSWIATTGQELASMSPVDGKEIAKVNMATVDEYNQVIGSAQAAFKDWRLMPAPQRGGGEG